VRHPDLADSADGIAVRRAVVASADSGADRDAGSRSYTDSEAVADLDSRTRTGSVADSEASRSVAVRSGTDRDRVRHSEGEATGSGLRPVS
jgi:hypothetical protein